MAPPSLTPPGKSSPDATQTETSNRRFLGSRLLNGLREMWGAIPGNLRGPAWVLMATCLLSIMLALIKLVGERIHVTQILCFRQFIMIMMAAPVIVSGFPGSLRSTRPDLQVLRVGAAFVAMLLGFTAVVHLPLATATTISFARTFFVTLLAIFILSEVVGIRRWAALVVGFLGVLIVAWPEADESLNIYSVMALASAACVALVTILIRKLSQVDQPVTILTYQAVGVGLLMLGPAIFFWKTPTFEEWILLLAIGIVSALGQTCNILALRAAEASLLAPLDYTRLIYALVFGWLIFSEWPEPRVFIGAGIIVAATAYTIHRERRRARAAKVASRAAVTGDH